MTFSSEDPSGQLRKGKGGMTFVGAGANCLMTVWEERPTADRCIVCGGRLIPSILHPRSTYAGGREYHIDICDTCGAGSTVPRPTADELAACYELAYDYSAHELIKTEKRRRAASLLGWAGITRGRLLDVGCMFGFLLDVAKKRGLETFGIELDRRVAEIARGKGHDVFAGTIEAYAAAHPDRRFDAIFAQHVIEHVPDPHAFLRAARSLLAPNGKFVACVPNFDARLRMLTRESWGWYQVPVHLQHYSPQSLARLFSDSGLAIVSRCTRGGDTLFLGITLLQSLGISPTRGVSSRRWSFFARSILAIVGEITRPYLMLGDDEFAAVAMLDR